MSTHREPDGVVIADGEDLRTQKTFRVIENGRWRELTLRVARGVIRDVPNREPKANKENL